jgi:hypothetical protein
MKKLLIISSIIFSIFLLALGAYYFLLKTNEKSASGKKVSIIDFFPFGKNGNTEQPEPKEEIPDQTDQLNDSFKERMRLISKDPVSGFTFIEKGDGLYIRYVEKGTGHIYDVSTFSDKKDKISNNTILNTQKVYFTNNGKSFVAQYLKDDNVIENKFITISGTSTETKLQVQNIDNSIESVSSGQNNGNLMYFSRKGVNSYVFISKFPKYENTQVWTDKIKHLNPQFLNDNLYLLTTKPNSQTEGYAYLVTNKGVVKKILGPSFGLTTKGDSFGEYVLFNNTYPGFNFISYNIKNNAFVYLSPGTFPEKCVFSLKNKKVAYCAVPTTTLNEKSLDNWYYGTEGFSDELWKYDVSTGVSEKLADLSEYTMKVTDIEEISIDKEENILLLKNKADGGSLWSFNINL